VREHLAALASGSFPVLILWGVNPAYTFPDAALWRSAAANVPLKVFIGLHGDETARDCQVVLPEHHWLESWGDYETSTDLLTLQQPAIGPLHDTRQGEDVVLRIIGALGVRTRSDYYKYLRARWQREVFPAASPVPFERFWSAALHDGVLRREARPNQRRRLRVPAVQASAARVAGRSAKSRTAKVSAEGASAVGGFELVLHPGAAVYDGRYANNGWLQELPDPITKATWSNPVSIAPADAEQLGLEDGDVVKIEARGRAVEIPVFVQPGQAAGVITGSLGYGRRALSVAEGVGVSLYPFLDERSSVSRFQTAVTLTRTGGRVALPMAQRHQWLEGRDIVRSHPLGHEAGDKGGHWGHGELPSLYPEQHFPEHKWGMAIDLSACVGCGACVVACQSENNIAVVGPEQVLKGREMHWMRVDRYYEGDPKSPAVLFQPMLCQQCDNAPCENVCPVNATNHTPDGLNQMVYNRCVGTRYCANNCPYKVRRFNFLEFTVGKVEPESLVYNPEVTVRPRGVMEKCTFCVQRIQDVRQRAKIERRAIRDGEITPACAAVCPAQAIVFGDLKDPESLVSKLSKDHRGYHVLAELGVKPAVTYLANITNPAGNGGGHEG
jgi:molybdopterin-containing oxidoreductase family iron-sulfur binding subunit